MQQTRPHLANRDQNGGVWGWAGQTRLRSQPSEWHAVNDYHAGRSCSCHALGKKSGRKAPLPPMFPPAELAALDITPLDAHMERNHTQIQPSTHHTSITHVIKYVQVRPLPCSLNSFPAFCTHTRTRTKAMCNPRQGAPEKACCEANDNSLWVLQLQLPPQHPAVGKNALGQNAGVCYAPPPGKLPLQTLQVP